MMVGTLSLVQKCQTSGCSGIVVYGGGDIVFGAKRSNQWMQYTVEQWYMVAGTLSLIQKVIKPVDTVCSGRSRIVVYGGGDIVFDTKWSNQWTQ